MKLNCSARDLPEFARRVPDISECEPQAELDRCLRVLSWLESLTVTELLRPHLPAINSDLISVVVPMYNSSCWIELCIKGLLAQTHANLEIFCVDDCSDDDTYERVVKQFGGDRRFCIVRLAKNVGPYQIKNWVTGSLSKGKLIAFQDADDISHPTRIAEQRQWILKHGYRICGTCAHQFFPSHIRPPSADSAPIEESKTLHNVVFYSSVQCMLEPLSVLDIMRQQVQTTCAGNHGSVSCYCSQMIDRSLFLEFGGFDGHTKVEADKEFNLRLLRFHNVGAVPKLLYSRRFHDLSLTRHPLTGYESAVRRKYLSNERSVRRPSGRR